MRKTIISRIITIVFVCLVVMTLGGCGGKSEFLGKWYEIDTEPEEYIEFTKNKTGFVSSENLTFNYEENGDEVIVTFSYGEAVKFNIIEMDGYKYLVEEGYDEPDWSNSMEGAIALETKRETAWAEAQKAREEEERKRQEEERKAAEEEAQKLEEEFQAGEEALRMFNGTVLTGRDEIFNVVLTIDDNGMCLLNVDSNDSGIGSSHHSYEGTLIRGDKPGEFYFNVTRAGYYYLIGGIKKDERDDTNIPEGRYDIFFNLVEEDGQYSTSKLYIDYWDTDSVECILEK